jgi:ribosomal protein L3 glutamine methyltransferase
MTIAFSKSTQDFNTIIDFLRYGITCANSQGIFYGHGSDNANDDILALILSTLSLPVNCHEALLHARLTKDEKALLSQNMALRINDRIPVAYITNEAYFCDLSFYVDERVLIPRSPIAELIKNQFSPWIDESRVERVLDLCTGSGCIAIACCYAFPEAIVDAVDISAQALEVAKINLESHELQDVLTLIKSDCYARVPETRYDIIVSNPPYVGADEMLSLPAEYLHEPKIALETEQNGLAIVEKILHQAHDYLTEDGILVVEVGNSDEALIDAYPMVPFTWIDFEQGGHGVFILTREQLIEYFN